MMIAARNAFLMSGAKLPYDAEVDYIASTGTQWIDTGILPASGDTVSAMLHLGYIGGADARRFCISDGNANVAHYAEITASNRWGINGNSTIPALSQGTLYDCGLALTSQQATLTAVVGGVEYTYSDSAYSTAKWIRTLRLFTLEWVFTGNGVAIGTARISINGELTRDLIAVRRTNELGQPEGAMFDRVSGELFGNAGTGAFIIGPDK